MILPDTNHSNASDSSLSGVTPPARLHLPDYEKPQSREQEQRSPCAEQLQRPLFVRLIPKPYLDVLIVQQSKHALLACRRYQPKTASVAGIANKL
jgi:hypothetical protein